MSELSEKVKASVERLKAFEPKNGEGYYLAFSGGKDSVVCKALLDMAGVKYDATYRVTSVDPPELVHFIKTVHPDVKMEIPRYKSGYKNPKLEGKPITMWNLIPEKRMPPLRHMRYCCELLKESGSVAGRMTITGVRWAESPSREQNQGIATILSLKARKELEDVNGFSVRKRGIILENDNEDTRRMIEQCYKRHLTNLNPIIEWTDSEVWEFIRANGIKYCSLYDEGFTRLGCIGCPLAKQKSREREFLRWPKYRTAYLNAFQKMLERREREKKPFKIWGTKYEKVAAQDVFNWWMEYDTLPGQYDLFEDYEIEED